MLHRAVSYSGPKKYAVPHPTQVEPPKPDDEKTSSTPSTTQVVVTPPTSTPSK